MRPAVSPASLGAQAPRAGPLCAEGFVWVEEAAGLHRQAAAADAPCRLALETLDALAALFELALPPPRDLLQVGVARGFGERNVGEGGLGVRSWGPESSGHRDERDGAPHFPDIAALVAGHAIRGDEAETLGELQRGRGDPGASDHLADRQRFTGCARAHQRLTLTST